MGLEQQGYPVVGRREMADLLQDRRQAEGIVAGAGCQYNRKLIGIELGGAVE